MTVARRYRFGAVAAALMVGISACGIGSNPGTDPAFEAAPDYVVIGNIAQLTGAAEPNGVQFNAGVQSGLAEVNAAGLLPDGWQVRVATEDDGTDIARSARLLSQMVSREGAHALLASGWTPISTALWPLANDNEVPLITASSLGGEAFQEDFFFSLLDLAGLPGRLGEHLLALGEMRIGLVIDGDNPGFRLVSDPIEKLLEDNSLEGFVSTETVSTGDTDYSAVLTNLVDADVDAVLLMVGPADVGNFLLQSGSVPEMADVTYLTHPAVSAAVATVAGETAVRLVFPQAWIVTDEGDALTFEEEAGTQANSYFAYGHDAVWLVAVAASMLLEEGRDVTGEGIRETLPDASRSSEYSARQYLDSLTLTADGLASAQAVMATFDEGGRIVPLEAASR